MDQNFKAGECYRLISLTETSFEDCLLTFGISSFIEAVVEKANIRRVNGICYEDKMSRTELKKWCELLLLYVVM